MKIETLNILLDRLKNVTNEDEKKRITRKFGKNRVNKLNLNEMYINAFSRHILVDPKNVVASTAVYDDNDGADRKIKKIYLTANKINEEKIENLKSLISTIIKVSCSEKVDKEETEKKFSEIFETELKKFGNKIKTTIDGLICNIAERKEDQTTKLINYDYQTQRDLGTYKDSIEKFRGKTDFLDRLGTFLKMFKNGRQEMKEDFQYGISNSQQFLERFYQLIECFINIRKFRDLNNNFLGENGIKEFDEIDGLLKNLIQVLSIFFDYSLLIYDGKKFFIEDFNTNDNIIIYKNAKDKNAKDTNGKESDKIAHAEVHLAFELIQLLNGVDKGQEFFIGVSKLCCPFCSKNLDYLNRHPDLKFKFKYPGSHNLIFTCHKYKFNSYEQTAEVYAQKTSDCLRKWLHFILKEPIDNKCHEEKCSCFRKWLENFLKENESSQIPIDNKCHDTECACFRKWLEKSLTENERSKIPIDNKCHEEKCSCFRKWLENILRENETPTDNKCHGMSKCAFQNNRTFDSKPSKLNQIPDYNQSPDVFYPYGGEENGDEDYSKFISNPKIQTLHKISNMLINQDNCKLLNWYDPYSIDFSSLIP